MVVLAVDPGSERLGLAVSDGDGRIAFPLDPVRVGPRGSHVADVARIAADRGAGRIVVGLPLMLTGVEGAAAERARVLAQAIAAATRLPVDLVDERLTTVQADRDLAAAGLRGRRRRARLDSAAAAILLQAYLDGAVAAAPGDGEYGEP